MVAELSLKLSAAPYPGLRPFGRDEADIFFGRDEQTDRLLARLRNSHFIAVVGASGCGKSSLVGAGMMAGLEAGLVAEAGARWLIAEMRPGDQPLGRLAEALLAPSALGPLYAGEEGAAQRVAATLRRGPLGLLEVLSEKTPPPRTNLLILVDQFEEIFRYRKRGGAEEAAAFVSLLLASRGEPDGCDREGEGRGRGVVGAVGRPLPVYVVLTMRSDYIGDCAVFYGLPEAVSDGQFLTPRMTREQTREAIVGPASVFGCAVEPALANRLLNDMGPEPDQLPLLQHALLRIWTVADKRGDTRMTLEDYKSLGEPPPAPQPRAAPAAPPAKPANGLGAVLSRDAEEAFAALEPEQQRLAEVLFRQLTVRDLGQRDTRRPALLKEVAAVAGLEPDKIEPLVRVIEVFRAPERSFVLPLKGDLTPETRLDISHESLIRQWKRLKDWSDTEARSADLYCRIREDARLWKRADCPPTGLWAADLLQRGNRWLEQQKPTPAWAARYEDESQGGGETAPGSFELVQEFLTASRRRERVRGIVYSLMGYFLLFGFVAMLFMWAWGQASVKAKNEAMAAKAEAEAERQKAYDLLKKYEVQKTRADQEAEKAEKAEENYTQAVANMEKFGGEPPEVQLGLTAEALRLKQKGQPIMPGASFGVLGSGGGGSICCVVRDAAGVQYLLSLSFIFPGKTGAQVIQPDEIDGGTGRDVIATVTRKGADTFSGALARILPEKQVQMEIPRYGKLGGVAETVQTGDEVWMVGRTSGLVKGRVIAVEKGAIITTRISDRGDAGAPVFTPDGRLVGLLAARERRGSSVVPIQPLLREMNVELAQ